MLTALKRSGRLAGIYTTYAGMLFGATWALDRWLVWQLQRDVAPRIADAELWDIRDEPEPLQIAATAAAPRCSVQECPEHPTAEIHGWPVCNTHDPRSGARVILPA